MTALPKACDVLIIGAGPAGTSAAALLHAAGLSTVVVEKQQFPRFVIGESLLPHCMDLLHESGLLEAAKARGYIVKRGALFLRGVERSDFSFSEQFTPGWSWTWQVPRADFDQTLVDAVAARGVPVIFRHEVTAVRLGAAPVVSVAAPDGHVTEVRTRFVLDGSGYGRVLPRLLGLERPSAQPPRKSVFAHFRGDRRPPGADTERIWIVSPRTGAWIWIIPFSDGITSFGVVGSPEVMERYPAEPAALLRAAIAEDPNCAPRLGEAEAIFEPRSLAGYSCSVSTVWGDGFALTGNATEFLDPVFSSGVTLALESASRAAKCVIRQLRGEAVDWESDYATPMRRGTDVFRTFVNGWYDGAFPEVIYSPRVSEPIRRMICSVLAGYVWDETNPFVSQHERKLAQVHRLVQGLRSGDTTGLG